MTKLSRALSAWGTQAEFHRRTGINKGSTSHLYGGAQNFSDDQRETVLRTFKAAGEENEALLFILADLKDRIPTSAKDQISVVTSSPSPKSSKKQPSRREAARLELLSALEREEPWAVDLAVVMDDFKADIASISD